MSTLSCSPGSCHQCPRHDEGCGEESVLNFFHVEQMPEQYWLLGAEDEPSAETLSGMIDEPILDDDTLAKLYTLV